MGNWDMATVKAVRNMRSKVTIALYDLEQSTIPEGEYMSLLRRRALRNLRAALVPYGVSIDDDDVRYWEEPSAKPDDLGEMVQYKSVGARWFPITNTVEFVGGARDGDHMVLRQGAVGQPVTMMAPMADPIWEPAEAGEPYPTVTLRRIEYNLAGWNERQRIWIYSPEKC